MQWLPYLWYQTLVATGCARADRLNIDFHRKCRVWLNVNTASWVSQVLYLMFFHVLFSRYLCLLGPSLKTLVYFLVVNSSTIAPRGVSAQACVWLRPSVSSFHWHGVSTARWCPQGTLQGLLCLWIWASVFAEQLPEMYGMCCGCLPQCIAIIFGREWRTTPTRSLLSTLRRADVFETIEKGPDFTSWTNITNASCINSSWIY